MGKRNAALGAAMIAAELFLPRFGSRGALAAPEPLYDERVARLVTEASFPGSGAVILIDRQIHTWSFDETVIERSLAVKILSGDGIDRFGDYVSDTYAKDLVDCRVEAVVVSPRGERTPVDRERIRKVEIGRSGFQYRAAFPGLEIGSIVEIVQTLRMEHGVTWGEWSFSSRVPALRSELIFRVPHGSLVSFTSTPKNAAATASLAQERKYDVHTLRMEMVAPFTDEKYMPMSNVGNPTVRYRVIQVTMEEYLRFLDIEYDASLAQYIQDSGIPWELPLAVKSWREIADGYSRYFDAETWKGADGADRYRTALRSLTNDLPARDTPGIVGELEGVVDVFHRQYQHAVGGFHYRNPEESVEIREGDAFESAYVLQRMLELRDIESTVVLASDLGHGLLDERTPDPFALNHPLLLVKWHGVKHWIDPSAPECGVDQLPWVCQGVRGMKLEGGEVFSFVTTPLDAAQANLVAIELDGGIDGAGRFAGRGRLRFTGQPMLDVRRRLAAGDEGTAGEALRGLLGELLPDGFEADSVAMTIDRKDTVVVICRIAKRDFGIRAGGVLGIEPAGWFKDRELDALAAESRRFEIVFPYPVSRTLSLRFAIPPGCSIEALPGFATHESELFSYKRSCREDNGRVLLRRTCSITTPNIKPQEYTEAKRQVEMIRKYDREPIVLKRDS